MAASPTRGATASPARGQNIRQDTDRGNRGNRGNRRDRRDPAPAQVLIYDGDCRFCVRRASWFRRKSQAQAVPYQQLDLPLQPDLTQQTLTQQTLTQQTLSRQAVWIDSAGRWHLGHRAVAKSLIHIGGWWGICGRIMLVPPISWLARGVYRLVARQRHRLA